MSKITEKRGLLRKNEGKGLVGAIQNRAERRCSVSLKEVSQSFLFGEVYTEYLWAATPNSTAVNNNHLFKHGTHNIKRKIAIGIFLGKSKQKKSFNKQIRNFVRFLSIWKTNCYQKALFLGLSAPKRQIFCYLKTFSVTAINSQSTSY